MFQSVENAGHGLGIFPPQDLCASTPLHVMDVLNVVLITSHCVPCALWGHVILATKSTVVLPRFVLLDHFVTPDAFAADPVPIDRCTLPIIAELFLMSA